MILQALTIVRNHATHALRKHLNITPIKKVLIANRGEIACRIMKTAKRLGVRTVAVYSDADQNSLHTMSADEAYHIGPAPSQESYLRGDKIIETAHKSGCQAIHPGYGFLSESAEFAELCEKEGLIFIGPPASAIRDMGIKNTSKAIMAAAGVPIINGYHGDDQSDEFLHREAEKIGFPLMIKAVRGGGGKGMRIAEKSEDFLSALHSARTESQKAFGDSSVLLERYVSLPRHVEVQVFADKYDNAVYLFERDCSVQRRHQKIIEEAPAPGLSESLRRNLGEAAVRAAKAVGYVGAGTVEFILDKNDLSFHFMEMNTRLQVEHPITEMITNTDLVEWQIRVASGEPLPLNQDQIKCRGHAFEARIYAENPRQNFLPGAGTLQHLSTPQPQKNVRVETGVRQGDEVSIHYDPMIAKLVVWSDTRSKALSSLVSRLSEYQITGLETNINFLIDLASHPHFQSGDVHTGFIDEHFDQLFPPSKVTDLDAVRAAVALIVNELNSAKLNQTMKNDPFVFSRGLRMNYDFERHMDLQCNGESYKIRVKCSNHAMFIKVNNSEWMKVSPQLLENDNKFVIQCNVDGSISSFSAVIDADKITLFNENGKTEWSLVQPKFCSALTDAEASSGTAIISPMPGVLEKVFVNAGDKVKKGDNLAVIIAMKMEHVLKAPRDATIKSVGGKPGQNMAKGQKVITFEEENVE